MPSRGSSAPRARAGRPTGGSSTPPASPSARPEWSRSRTWQTPACRCSTPRAGSHSRSARPAGPAPGAAGSARLSTSRSARPGTSTSSTSATTPSPYTRPTARSGRGSGRPGCPGRPTGSLPARAASTSMPHPGWSPSPTHGTSACRCSAPTARLRSSSARPATPPASSSSPRASRSARPG